MLPSTLVLGKGEAEARLGWATGHIAQCRAQQKGLLQGLTLQVHLLPFCEGTATAHTDCTQWVVVLVPSLQREQRVKGQELGQMQPLQDPEAGGPWAGPGAEAN